VVEALAADELGEGPVWLGSRLLRVDIHAPAIVLRDTVAGSERRRAVGAHVGFAVPAGGGGLVAGVGRELVRFAELEADPEPIAAVEPGRADNRFNDAAVDARGRLWCTGSRPAARRSSRCPGRRSPMGSTGTWTRPGSTTSTPRPSASTRSTSTSTAAGSGRAGPSPSSIRRMACPTGCASTPKAAYGWRCSAAGRSGATGRTAGSRRISPLPLTNPTSLAFGGPGLRELFVTSARHRLTPAQLSREPLAGSLLRLRPGVAGRETNRFGGQAARATLRACSCR
jgi:sugar lactone lactonase YvrE